MKTAAFLTLGLCGLAGLLSGCNSLYPKAALGMSFPAPSPDKALIVFYRQQNPLEAAQPFTVKQDRAVVGELGNKTYLLYYTIPGTHLYSIAQRAHSEKSLEVGGGMTYFMEVTVLAKDPTKVPRVRVASLQEAQKALPALTDADQIDGHGSAELTMSGR
jgi:hypothetical protein